ncbi:MAG: choice-of-anchor tandem repeat GloVer-containing protein [Bacteroidota bacterium]
MKKSMLNLTLTVLLIANFLLPSFSFGQYTKLLDFTGINGRQPFGSLFSDGTFLYGMTQLGGTSNLGVIYKIKPDGTGYNKLLDFADTTNGSHPWGSLISDGTFLYGMTYDGGANSMGVIFKIKSDGTGYSKLKDFSGINGAHPISSLISEGTFLYGMTYRGGISDAGVIFKIMPDGTGYSKLWDFDGSINGSLPSGSLISDGTFLYGMTVLGGANQMGVIFKIKLDGTGYSKLLDFSGSNGNAGSSSLISDGTFLYGMAYQGGTNGAGVIFKIKPDGTGYLKLKDFPTLMNGGGPTGSLIFDGTFLYGANEGPPGGLYNTGVIFEIMPDGTGYTDLFYFDPDTLGFGNASGSKVIGDLISDGTSLYGMAVQGGTGSCPYGCGTIFKFHPIGMGIAENDVAESFKVLPNPSNGMFMIGTEENNYMFMITNVLGENIYKSGFINQKTEIDLSKEPNGIYFLNIKTEKEAYTKKIIINR